ncbi:unnamed protein product [Darwinula stevensoni]|uniref:Uncharacterized protein n=1 Tax=Darwinula stevensoni TaxID=69355 RepID=A0A7R8WXQ5_9CRUS|nr:unnamed protein product [Darwinula stevensoni]CAG0878583.1 unnamed protein product [Darwinula stevensoni]
MPRLKPRILISFLSPILVLFLVFNVQGHFERERSRFPLVLLVSFDGFGHDYFEKAKTPNFDLLKKEGAFIPRLTPVFVTKTFPNHQSIVTGLFAESHGVLGSSLYDQANESLVDLFSDGEFYATKNSKAIPVWTLNEDADEGRKSGVVAWPGYNFHYGSNHRLPTHSMSFASNLTYRQWVKSMDTAISWFEHHTTPANLVVFYLAEPDTTGHLYGPESEQVKEKISQIDDLVGHMVSKLKELELLSEVNLIILSDHGMLSVPRKNIIHLRDIADPRDYHIANSSPSLFIYPNPGKEAKVLEAFKKASMQMNFTFYETWSAPDHWHFKENPYLPPFFIIADKGYAFDEVPWLVNYNDGQEFHGVHGYDNLMPEMQPFFLARGPAFKKGYVGSSLESVDIYPLLCHLLQLTPNPNNGSLIHALPLLIQPPSHIFSLIEIIAAYMLACFAVMIAACFVLGAMWQPRTKSSVETYNLWSRNGEKESNADESVKLLVNEDDVSP